MEDLFDSALFHSTSLYSTLFQSIIFHQSNKSLKELDYMRSVIRCNYAFIEFVVVRLKLGDLKKKIKFYLLILKICV
jgi:hypothetical protein